MATQVRIRRRGRVRAMLVAGCAAAMCLLPAGTASADTGDSSASANSALSVSDVRDDALLPVDTDLTLLAVAGFAALGIGAVVVKKAGI